MHERIFGVLANETDKTALSTTIIGNDGAL